ncbi:MAG: autotransporter domain-containing protein [Deltaproteobacteria bacterium]|jgi:outer membrane autotransporter protein|nr:autotransporter domain-containing protein [Deltaproteobacteria bacterium]
MIGFRRIKNSQWLFWSIALLVAFAFLAAASQTATAAAPTDVVISDSSDLNDHTYAGGTALGFTSSNDIYVPDGNTTPSASGFNLVIDAGSETFSNVPFVGGLSVGNGTVTNSGVDLRDADGSSVTGGINSVAGFMLTLVGGGVFGDGTVGGTGADDGNTVKVGFAVTGGVLGGIVSGEGSAIGNSVSVAAGIGDPSDDFYVVGGVVFGGSSGADVAYSNTVTVSSGNFVGTINGHGNFFGALVKSGVVGATSASSTDDTKGNTVDISGGSFADAIYISGGFADDGSALYNDVIISAGAFDADVTVSGGRVVADITAAATVKGNEITISGSATFTGSTAVVGGEINAATKANAVVTENKVDITLAGSTHSIEHVIGGEVTSIATSIPGNPTISENTVNITGSGSNTLTVDTIAGGMVDDANNEGASLTHNIVNVEDITIVGKVYGANVNANGVTGLTATLNEVNLTNATVTGSVYGAYNDTSGGSDIAGGTNAVTFKSGTNRVTADVRAAGTIVAEGGTNYLGTSASNAITAVSVDIKGSSTNYFQGASVITTDANFSELATANVTAAFSAGGKIDITGGANFDFNAAGALTAVGDINVGQNSSLKIQNASNVAAANIVVAEDAKLAIGSTAVTINADLDLANNSILSFGWSGASGGSITLDAGKTTTIAAGGAVTVEIDGTVTSGGMILTSPTGDLDINQFFSLYDLPVENGDTQLVLGGKLSLGDALAATGAKLGVRGTPNYAAAADLFDRIETNAASDLDLINALQNLVITGLPNLPNPELAFKQLIGESLVNVTSAVSQTTLKAQGLVYGRLDRIREIEGVTPPAAGAYAPSAGDGGELNRVWVGTFGMWTDVSNRDFVFGYDYKATGFALGYDRVVAAVPGLRLGISTAFSYGTLDTNDRATTVDIDTAGVGVYASYLSSVGVFVDGSISYSRAKNDYDTTFISGSRKSGSFDIDSWQFGARVGAVLKANNFQFIPSVGVRFLTIDQEGWAETIDPALAPFANRFDGLKDHQVDIPIQLKINTTIGSGSMKFVPELRLGWTIAAKRADDSLRYGFVGSPERAEVSGVKPARNAFNGGLGFKLVTGSGADVFLNYDYEGASGFKNHQLGVGIGYEF